MHCYIPAHNLKYMADDSFLEGGLVLIMVELALNFTVKNYFIAMNFSKLWLFSAGEIHLIFLYPALPENVIF